jgi:AraC family transcriptional regulator
MEPRFIEARPITLAGLERRYQFGKVEEIPQLWNAFGPQIGHIPNQVGEVAYGVCYGMDDSSFSYMAAVEVSDRSALPAAFKVLDWPARRYAAFTHSGDVTTLPNTIRHIWREWLPTSGLEVDKELGFFERYGENFDPVTESGDIEVWIPIKE